MSITVEFRDFEEMKNFARELLGQEASQAPVPVQQEIAQAPAVQPVPVAVSNQVVSAPVNQVPISQPAAVAQPPVTCAASMAQTATPVVPTTTAVYTMDDLCKAGMTLMDSGKQGELQGLLANFGVEALPALPPSQYGAFATALRGLGAQI